MNKPKSTSELLSAPTQKALEEILQDSRSDDACTRLLAFERFTEVFRKFIGPDPAESTMHMAAKLLEKGFLKAIAGGLDECVADPWKLLGGGANPDDCDVLQIQSEVCIQALECLALDSRTVRYILQEVPSLPAVLMTLFLEEMTPAERSVCPAEIKVRGRSSRRSPSSFWSNLCASRPAEAQNF